MNGREIAKDDRPGTPSLTVGQAAELLGVHPTTLRRWTQQGRIRFVRTVGGHRRFSRESLESVARQRAGLRVVGGLEMRWADRALQDTRREMSAAPLRMEALSPDDRDAFRVLGHRLLSLCRRYIGMQRGGAGLLGEAERIGRDYAKRGAQAGLSLQDIFRALLFFRDRMTESLFQLPAAEPLKPEAHLRAIQRLGQVFNTVELSLIGAAQGRDHAA